MPPSWLDMQEDESIQFASHPSRWLSFWPALAFAAAVAVVGVVVASGLLAGVTVDGIPLQYLLFAIVAIAAVPLVRAEINRRSTWYVVTDDHVWYKTGILGRHVDPLPLEQVVDIKIDQSATDRFLFGNGDVKMANAGTGSVDMAFRNVPNPNDVAAIIRDHREPIRSEPTPQ